MPVQRYAPALTGPVLSAQQWRDLTLLHWPVDPAQVASLMPAGVRPDVLDGRTYVGLVPFVMRRAGPANHLPVPYFGDFCETNVRLYSVDDAGRHGIVFLTLDAARLATVLLARVSLGLPYAWSWMRASGSGAVWTYRSQRRWPRGWSTSSSGPSCAVTVRVGERIEPDEREIWLTSRWGLHTRVAGRTLWVPNQHASWPLRSAEVTALDSDLVAACGITVDPTTMLRPIFSEGVRTTFGLPSVVTR